MLLTDQSEPVKAAAELNDMGIFCVAVTLGCKGALVSVGGKGMMVDSYPPKALDSTGAGDAFWGGFLHRMLAQNKRANQLTLEEAADCANWGNAVATCCVQKRGAIPAMPAREEVLQLMEKYPHRGDSVKYKEYK